MIFIKIFVELFYLFILHMNTDSLLNILNDDQPLVTIDKNSLIKFIVACKEHQQKLKDAENEIAKLKDLIEAYKNIFKNIRDELPEEDE